MTIEYKVPEDKYKQHPARKVIQRTDLQGWSFGVGTKKSSRTVEKAVPTTSKIDSKR